MVEVGPMAFPILLPDMKLAKFGPSDGAGDTIVSAGGYFVSAGRYFTPRFSRGVFRFSRRVFHTPAEKKWGTRSFQPGSTSPESAIHAKARTLHSYPNKFEVARWLPSDHSILVQSRGSQGLTKVANV